MHQKDYALNMVKSLQTGIYVRHDVINDVFAGAAHLAADLDIQEEVKKSLLYLVSESILSAAQAENIIRRYYANLVTEKNRQRKARSLPNIGNTLYGPFVDIYDNGIGGVKLSSIVIDMSRMPRSWIEEFSNGTEQQRAELLAPHIEASNARQTEPT